MSDTLMLVLGLVPSVALVAGLATWFLVVRRMEEIKAGDRDRERLRSE